MSSNSTLRRRGAFAAVALAAMSVTACASGLGPNDYSRSTVGAVARVEPAVVLSSRLVKIEGTKSGVGSVGGAVIGGAAASQIGGGSTEQFIAGAIGAIAGGLAGAAVEEGVTGQTGIAYTVRLERSGEIVTITQAGTSALPNGAPVWLEYGPRARITPRY